MSSLLGLFSTGIKRGRLEVINYEERTPQGELVEGLITIVSYFAGRL